MSHFTVFHILLSSTIVVVDNNFLNLLTSCLLSFRIPVDEGLLLILMLFLPIFCDEKIILLFAWNMWLLVWFSYLPVTSGFQRTASSQLRNQMYMFLWNSSQCVFSSFSLQYQIGLSSICLKSVMKVRFKCCIGMHLKYLLDFVRSLQGPKSVNDPRLLAL